MRLALSTAMIALATSMSFMSPAQAQGGAYMWCVAWTDNGTEKSYYYSAFFPAEAGEAERKALKFKSEVEDEEISASNATATCMAPAELGKATATRNAAMKASPGTVLDWAG